MAPGCLVTVLLEEECKSIMAGRWWCWPSVIPHIKVLGDRYNLNLITIVLPTLIRFPRLMLGYFN